MKKSDSNFRSHFVDININNLASVQSNKKMKNLSARFYIHLFNFIKMNETLRNNNLYYYFITLI
ncbi:unnamed protein product [Tenebrio molitor]|nr:unnamed protein product [Tenebrio molitor]